MKINNLIDLHADFERVWVHLLADFTLESFPVIGADVLVSGTWTFELLLCKNPVLKALEVNNTNRSLTLAGNDKGVLVIVFSTPANSALDLIFTFIDVLNSFDFHGLSKLLIVQFILRHFYLITSEIFYSESHSSKLDGVELLNLVVIFASFVFK